MERASKKIKRTIFIAIVVIAVLFLLPGACSFGDDTSSDAPAPSDKTITIKGGRNVILNKGYWDQLLNQAAEAPSLVTLDLSGCAVDTDIGTSDSLDLSIAGYSPLFTWTEDFPKNTAKNRKWVVFDPKRGTPHNGKSKIARLILPDAATLIPDGNGKTDRRSQTKGTVEYGMRTVEVLTATFKDFTALKSVTGAGIEQIGLCPFKDSGTGGLSGGRSCPWGLGVSHFICYPSQGAHLQSNCWI